MAKIFKYLFSMSLMAVGLLAFFIAIAAATFIENDFGTPVAQKWVYKSWWFGCIIGYLSLCLIANIFKYQMIQLKKIGLLTFHVAFLVIIAGALCTRLTGFEGMMHIREGESSNEIISNDTYVQVKVHDYNLQYAADYPIIIDTNVYSTDASGKPDLTHNYFKEEFEFPGQADPISIEYVDLLKSVHDTLISVDGGREYIELVTTSGNGREYHFIESGTIRDFDGLRISFNNDSLTDAIKVSSSDSGIYVMSPYDINYFQMRDNTTGIVGRDSLQEFPIRRQYIVGNLMFVFSRYMASAKIEYMPGTGPASPLDGLKVRVKQGELSTEVMLQGGKGIKPNKVYFRLGDLNYELAYGSKIISLPFSIFLRDFEMDRYPGTNNPSSFSSMVTVVDPRTDKTMDHHIYMNNVLDYDGFRFFQGFYDEDEHGSILSVNHDALGTNVTYNGYLLLGLGFVMNLFSRNSRFRFLIGKSQETRKKRMGLKTLLVLFSLTFSFGSFGQAVNKVVDYDHAEAFGHLVIQDIEGRLKPVHSLATDLLHKIYRKDTYKGQSAMQVFVGIHTNRLDWNLEPMIALPSDEIAKSLNLHEDSSYACVMDFLTPDFRYLLQEEVKAAHMKRPATRNEHDKNLIKVDERFNIMIGMFSGFYLKIFPKPNDSTDTWYSPFDPEMKLDSAEAEFANLVTSGYLYAVDQAYVTGNWEEANLGIDLITEYQQRNANPEIMPSAAKIEWEIRYNKMNLFKRLASFYILIGGLLLFLQFIQIFVPRFNLKWPLRIAVWLFAACFVLHGAGLGLRWYLSGHAPWSNGYEAVVFIAFITVLAGLLFYKQNKIILGATGILAWLMLFVAHMNSLDPEMTNLVPVLKSYWLMIHVAIITGSYGFLGLGAILALVTLTMYLFVSESNKSRMGLLSKELTYVAEMTIIAGLFMLTIGTFLGGVWANESWGRYWGWDAKETWALASVLVYSIILHFRFVPGLKGQFAMNTASLWGYSSIIMTFFGVNFYLSGLHSYAAGDPIPIPTWVPITVGLLAALNIVSYIRYRSIFKSSNG